jgi:hypothetical protein
MLNFSEIADLWQFRTGEHIDVAELYAALETLEIEGQLIYAVIGDKICHVPVSADAELREMGVQYWTAQRGKVRA